MSCELSLPFWLLLWPDECHANAILVRPAGCPKRALSRRRRDRRFWRVALVFPFTADPRHVIDLGFVDFE